ncbi:caspase activity and apoptosis inhibitor 1 [Chanos chanos]|uniref:Caspase activity and apoptosis inhibitor 1 n=1 Tax=Chanos chanos TaxID=29144 RepID=A0A6J2VTU4_CHACN|nr:caspase activity and apoptosis inhibitor 1 [Chanos chanos]
MLEKKAAKEKKRKHSRRESSEGDRKRRNTESSVEDAKEEKEPVEVAVEEPSDMEEGGLDLAVHFKPISAYIEDRQEMLEQCFRVLGENKLKKMLPDDLKDCSIEEIKRLCWEQLQQLSQSNLLKILEGRELGASSDTEEDRTKKDSTYSQQDNNVDSTSSVKESTEAEDQKQGGASGEESDVLSINADDSDIEGQKDEKTQETPSAEETATVSVPTAAATPAQPSPPPPEVPHPGPKEELQHDIDKSVSEILALATPPLQTPSSVALPRKPALVDTQPNPPPRLLPVSTVTGPSQPSAQQLELLELEMRARAIKALMKANEIKKQANT